MEFPTFDPEPYGGLDNKPTSWDFMSITRLVFICPACWWEAMGGFVVPIRSKVHTCIRRWYHQ